MTRRIGIEVSAAVAEAAKLADVDVIAAYPITPQTHIVETLASLVANGELDAEYINVESEHSAMSACVGASAAGARVFTSTSSQGLALMHEMLYIASACRLPIVMSVVNRALSGPINIWCDHQDSLGERDTGWIQIYVEDGQEAFDTTLQAFKIAEDHRVLTPIMVCMDGFILSHVIEPIAILDEEEVGRFLSKKYTPKNSLHPENPVSIGLLAGPDYYFELRRQQVEALDSAKKVILKVDEEYRELFGRGYGLFDSYKIDDADVIFLTVGSMTGTAKVAVDKLREQGKKVGVLKLRVFRPHPYKEIYEAVRHAKVLAVVDRNLEPGAYGGVFFGEVRSAFLDYDEKPKVINFIAGLGGRDITVTDFLSMADKALKVAETGVVKQDVEYVGLRE
jgi:pyruvate ferredoxin oxidoreductase alpha subunit